MKKFAIGIAVVLFLFALPLWSQQSAGAPDFLEALRELLQEDDWSPAEIRELIKQEVDWSQTQFRYAEIAAYCLRYAKGTGEQISPFAQAQLAKAVAEMAREMGALGFGKPAIVRTALNGTREALEGLSRLRLRKEEDTETGAGDLIRARVREELQAALYLETRQMAQARDQEQRKSRPDDLLVPPGPQGPPGKANPNN